MNDLACLVGAANAAARKCPGFQQDHRCTLRFSADVFPLFATSSYSTTCPSLRPLRPALSTAEIWTNTSFPPLRLNKSISFLRIKPLHSAARHSRSPLLPLDGCFAYER